MARKKTETRTPGHEPLLSGRPDPIPPVVADTKTHMPAGGGQGTVCGVRPTPTHASEYSATAPTCPFCARYLAAAQESTRQILRNRAAASKAGE